MLLACDERQAADLEERCEALRAAGQDAQLLDAGQAEQAEPALRLPVEGAALLTPRDAQLVCTAPINCPQILGVRVRVSFRVEVRDRVGVASLTGQRLDSELQGPGATKRAQLPASA